VPANLDADSIGGRPWPPARCRCRPRCSHEARLAGQIPQALGQVAPDLLAADPDIRTVDVIAAK
jgi:hypothetical protein